MRTYTLACIMLAALLSSTPLSSFAEDVIVTITGIKNNSGNMRVHIFTDAENFKEKKAYKKINFSKQEVKNGTLTLRLTLPAGEYGISLLDDENKNNKMDYNLIHMPKEGFGFSDYYHSGLSMPDYNDFHFSLKKDDTKRVTVKLRYM
ncbi:MAG: DUF2141 domain-containing protein [Chitinophagales bacterium]|nr:DUF2141 domain-containing protein [Chitinophagaceae bacterium]MCB9066128.1 DUF2141 domain-containing protein [Chitinophagales bacterium]